MKVSNRVYVCWFMISAAGLPALLSGWAWGDFTPYSGQQQNWPTRPGSFVATQYAIPVYIHSYPDRLYNVIGFLDATTAPIRRRVVAFEAQRAKELGADAIIVFQEGKSMLAQSARGTPSRSQFLSRWL